MFVCPIKAIEGITVVPAFPTVAWLKYNLPWTYSSLAKYDVCPIPIPPVTPTVVKKIGDKFTIEDSNDTTIGQISHFYGNIGVIVKAYTYLLSVGKENFDWQVDLAGGDDESLTWANLWVNGNYPQFVFQTLPILYSKDCVFVGHESADTSKLPFIKKDFRVGYNAFINDYDKIEIIRKWIEENNITNHVFLFSASTFTNLAVYELFRDFPNNSYIDIGTCLTPMMNMPTHRGYLEAFWGYRGGADIQKICIW